MILVARHIKQVESVSRATQRHSIGIRSSALDRTSSFRDRATRLLFYFTISSSDRRRQWKRQRWLFRPCVAGSFFCRSLGGGGSLDELRYRFRSYESTTPDDDAGQLSIVQQPVD
jgi:hypothetical protein